LNSATFHMPANPTEAHKVYAGPLREMIKALCVAGHALVVEVRTAEDVKTDKQRRYLHGYVLLTIAREAVVNGQRFDMRTWKEHLRATFLGWKTVTYKNPITGKKVRRRERVSTESLGVKGYSEYIERVTAHAATELGVTFREEWIDPETGEVFLLSAMKSKRAA
jgi:NinB protein